MTYSMNDIAGILAEYSTTNLSIRKFAKKKGISNKALRSWLSGDLPSNKPRRIPKPLDVDMEEKLAAWVRSERKLGTPISRADIQKQARTLAKKGGHHSFGSTSGWTTKFLRRNRFAGRTGTKEGRKLVFTEDDMVRRQLNFCKLAKSGTADYYSNFIYSLKRMDS